MQPLTHPSRSARPARRRKAPRSVKPAERAPTCIEIDIADPNTSAAEIWLQQETDIYMRLEELFPGDPGQLSGATVRFSDSGVEYACLTAYFGDHCLGLLNERELVGFLHLALRRVARGHGEDVIADLRETYPEIEPLRPSGAWLKFDGETITVWFGQHCCGIARGPIVLDFFRRAWARTVGEQEGNVVEISAFRPRAALRVN